MNKQYYLKNLLWGVIGFFIAYFVCYDKSKFSANETFLFMSWLLLSSLFFPFAKKMIEDIALRYTTREFWRTGIFIETPAKNGAYAVYYFTCFILSIPVGFFLIIVFVIKHAIRK